MNLLFKPPLPHSPLSKDKPVFFVHVLIHNKRIFAICLFAYMKLGSIFCSSMLWGCFHVSA